MSRLETGWHPMMAFTASLWIGNLTPCSCLSSQPPKKSLWPSGVDVSPKFLGFFFSQRTSQSRRMFHRYLFISWVSSTFPLLSVISHSKCLEWCCFWHVAILVHRSYTFHLHPDGQQRKARSLFRTATEPVWIELSLSSSCGVSWAMSSSHRHHLGQCHMAEPIPLHARPQPMPSIYIGGSPWSWTRSYWVPEGTSSALADNLHRGGHSPSDVVLTSPPHVV